MAIFFIGMVTVILMWHSLFLTIEKYHGFEKPFWFHAYFVGFMAYSIFIPFATINNFISGASKNTQTSIASLIIIIMWSCFIYCSRHIRAEENK